MTAAVPAEFTPDWWSHQVRQLLHRLDEPLLRSVAQKLIKPRNQWPVDELIDRCLAMLTNPVTVDRKLKELPASSRKVLALIGLSRQPRWKIGHLLAILATLGESDGLLPIQTLIETGLLYPEQPPHSGKLKSWEEWLGVSGIVQAKVYAHPSVVERIRNEDLGLPELPALEAPLESPRFSDGLEWPIRLAIAWQQVSETPLRLTLQHSLFKRDLNRLQTDPLWNADFADELVKLPDPGLFALHLAELAGLLHYHDSELRAQPFPPAWEAGLKTVLTTLWAATPGLESWDPLRGYSPVEEGVHPYPSLAILALLALTKVPAGHWLAPSTLADWLLEKHPAWASGLSGSADEKRAQAATWMRGLLAGVFYAMRLTEAIAPHGSEIHVRLSDLGRHLLLGGPEPQLQHDFRQTLLVQPNCEMLVYRQGLTPALLGRLTRFARWKTLGAACTLELTAQRVYLGLESGLALRDILQTLTQHGMRPIPATVTDLLQRWSNKRERISIFPSAILLEFANAADLDDALNRGLVSLKITERIGLVESGQELDYRQFRLLGNRDYEAKPQRCIHMDADGIGFTVDVTQSDLLLEAELGRLAEPLPSDEVSQRRYRLTPRSLRQALATGWTLQDLDQWFLERSGSGLSASARLLLNGPDTEPWPVRRQLVLHVPTVELADGLVQWPPTSACIAQRLGPTALALHAEQVATLRQHLNELGLTLLLPEDHQPG